MCGRGGIGRRKKRRTTRESEESKPLFAKRKPFRLRAIFAFELEEESERLEFSIAEIVENVKQARCTSRATPIDQEFGPEKRRRMRGGGRVAFFFLADDD